MCGGHDLCLIIVPLFILHSIHFHLTQLPIQIQISYLFTFLRSRLTVPSLVQTAVSRHVSVRRTLTIRTEWSPTTGSLVMNVGRRTKLPSQPPCVTITQHPQMPSHSSRMPKSLPKLKLRTKILPSPRLLSLPTIVSLW